MLIYINSRVIAIWRSTPIRNGAFNGKLMQLPFEFLMLPSKSAVIQKRLFVRRRSSSEQRIAMREAAEALDDVAMNHRKPLRLAAK